MIENYLSDYKCMFQILRKRDNLTHEHWQHDLHSTCFLTCNCVYIHNHVSDQYNLASEKKESFQHAKATSLICK